MWTLLCSLLPLSFHQLLTSHQNRTLYTCGGKNNTGLFTAHDKKHKICFQNLEGLFCLSVLIPEISGWGKALAGNYLQKLNFVKQKKSSWPWEPWTGHEKAELHRWQHITSVEACMIAVRWRSFPTSQNHQEIWLKEKEWTK